MIEEYSKNSTLIRNWTTNNELMMPFNLSYSTDKVKISLCPIIYVNLTVGKKTK